jgi:hypothetical protein
MLGKVIFHPSSLARPPLFLHIFPTTRMQRNEFSIYRCTLGKIEHKIHTLYFMLCCVSVNTYMFIHRFSARWTSFPSALADCGKRRLQTHSASSSDCMFFGVIGHGFHRWNSGWIILLFPKRWILFYIFCLIRHYLSYERTICYQCVINVQM